MVEVVIDLFVYSPRQIMKYEVCQNSYSETRLSFSWMNGSTFRACAHNILRHKGFLVQFWDYTTIYMFQASQDKCTIFSHQGWCYACCYGMSILRIVFWERPKESNGSIINVIKILAIAKSLLLSSKVYVIFLW